MAKKKTPNGVDLVTMVHPQSAAAEAFRILRTNLGFTSPDHPCRSLLVTSPGLDDGKTLTACNLAVVLAQAGHKVLLVDCDLRRPLIHRLFGLENEHGFTNTLLHKRPPAGSIHRVNQGLSVLTSGPVPPNPAEIISASKTRVFWQEQLKSFDYLVVDSPP
ncbi:MAG: CpsD/CapB family tyrosine-protein kinase, partial [Candidatus Desulforudis sp.]|nr:CpsD/CapB family tyrosine-protein kinase [Desulforudis sp.]